MSISLIHTHSRRV